MGPGRGQAWHSLLIQSGRHGTERAVIVNAADEAVIIPINSARHNLSWEIVTEKGRGLGRRIALGQRGGVAPQSAKSCVEFATGGPSRKWQ